jgi:hypothetical protein
MRLRLRPKPTPAPAINIIEAMDDPALLAPYYSGDSWATWRTVLKAAYALPLDAVELAIFHNIAGDREPPKKQVRELWCLSVEGVGRTVSPH